MKSAMVSALSALTGIAAGAVVTAKNSNKAIAKERAMSDKHLALFLMMNRWVQIKQEGKNLADYLAEKNYRMIAIYGMSYAGERLVEELKDSEIKVRYGIDRNAGGLYTETEVMTPEDVLEEVDAVIVTSIFYIDEIEKDLSTKLSCPVISLEDILYDI